MNAILHVPARRIQGVGRLGQHPMQYDFMKPKPNPQAKPVGVKDIETVVKMGQFDLAEKSTEELKRLYGFVIHAIAARAKAAFLSNMLKFITGEPGLFAQYNQMPDGAKFLRALQAGKAFFMAMTQPKIFKTLQNLKTDLEVNHLSKRGIAIEGIMPIYMNDANKLSYAQTKVPAAGETVETIDFGNLQKTDIVSDFDAMKLSASELNAVPKLGAALTTAAIVVIIVKWVVMPLIVAGAVVWVVSDITAAASAPVEPPPDWIFKYPPEVVEKWMDMSGQGDSILGSVKSILKWLVVGGVVFIIGGVALHYAT